MPGGWGVPCAPAMPINFYFPIGDAQGQTRTGNPKTNPNG